MPFGTAMLALWAGERALILGMVAKLTGRKTDSARKWAEVWAARRDWLEGYQ